MSRSRSRRRTWLPFIILALWLAQVGWLGWRFAPEAAELTERLFRGQIGDAMRHADPFYQGLAALADSMPPEATYVFLDRYEAGKEIEARYFLYPRRHVLLRPQASPAVLFNRLVQEKAGYLIIRRGNRAAALSYLEKPSHPAFQRLKTSPAGVLYKVQYQRLVKDFHD